MNHLLSIYRELEKLPRGEKIDNPDELIFLMRTKFPISISYTSNLPIYVTKRSLKHIAEKQDSELIRTMIDVCSNCDEIRLGKIKNRILLVKQIEKRDNRHYAVSLEERDDALIIVTVFPTDQKYLSNFDLLWRTGAS